MSLCLPQFYCLHHLEGGIIHCLETGAQISMDIKGYFLPREFDYSVLYRNMLWLDFCYLLLFQLYVAWRCDTINKITGLKYRLNVCKYIHLKQMWLPERKEILFNGLYKNNKFEVAVFPHTPHMLSCWCEARAPLESEHLLELLFPVSSCKNPILENHSFLLLLLPFCITADELY